MCGIVGIHRLTDRGRWDLKNFDAMVDSLAHRGPDGRGVWHGEGISLGHRRLAILDPTPLGAQPMSLPEAELSITYNGEIYNFREIRKDLEQRGHRFRSDCDTEVLLHAYAEWGRDCVERLNGIFAFAIWDGRNRSLWLVRDRLGIKPLYYSIQGGLIRFASEPRAILTDPNFLRRPDPHGIHCFLSFGFIPAPWTSFQDLHQLAPAEEMIIQDGVIKRRKYWSLKMNQELPGRGSFVEEFASRFEQAVRSQMVSDVPLGAFLSGGVDSAAVVAAMSTSSQDPIRTFSVGFSRKSFDEREAAQETAERIGSIHNQMEVDFDFDRTLDEWLPTNDVPFADSSSLAVHHLAQMTRSEVKVALSGDGADELLAGYPTYSATRLASWFRRIPRPVRWGIRAGVNLLSITDEKYSLRQFASRFVRGAEESEGRDFASWRIHFSGRDKQSLCQPEFLNVDIDPVSEYASHYFAPEAGTSPLKRMLHADLTFYLPGDMLVKVDRMSMLHGLEVRVPFLDHTLVEYCVQLPDQQLARLPFPGKNKLILREYLSQKLGVRYSRRKKRGFNVPIESAMRTTLSDRFLDLVREKRFASEGPFQVQKLIQLHQDHRHGKLDAGHALFSALVLADWWQRAFSSPASSQTGSLRAA